MTSSLIRRLTKFFGLKVINYDFPRWHTAEWENWDAVDALLNASGVINVKGVWANSTAYVIGNRLIDAELGTIWQCAVNHTSAATGLFAADRTTNPSYWTAFSTLPNNRGAWTTATAYTPGDIAVVSSYKYYYCTATHISAAAFVTDASKWTLVWDATVTIDACAAIYDTFDDRYLGAKASAPTVDNDGNALLTGALYFNTTSNDSWFWNGTIWVTSISYVADNSVTNAKMAVNAIGTAELIDGLLTADAAGRLKMADKYVTLAKMDDIASGNMLGRVTAGAGVPELITPAQHRTWATNATRTITSASSAGDRTFTAADAGRAIILNGSASFTMTFDPAATLGNGWAVDVKCTTSVIVTLDPNSTETIDGSTTITLARGQQCRIVCDGSGFQTIGLSKEVIIAEIATTSAVSAIEIAWPPGYTYFDLQGDATYSTPTVSLMQLSNNGGSSWVSSGYIGATDWRGSDASSGGANTDAGGLQFSTDAVGIRSTFSAIGQIGDLASQCALATSYAYYGGGILYSYRARSVLSTALAGVNRMRLLPGTGNINSGSTFTMRGRRL